MWGSAVGREGGDNRRGESEAFSTDVTSVLGEDLNSVNGKTCREGGWAPVNAYHPSLLRNVASSYSAAYSKKAVVYQKEYEKIFIGLW